MPIKNHVIADIPAKNLAYGFDDYATALAEAIIGAQEPRFTIGIYGKWGCGKSTLLGAIGRKLEPPAIIPISFDAWRYQESSDIIIPLLFSIDKGLSELPDTTSLRGRLIGAIRAFSRARLTLKSPLLEVSLDQSDRTQERDERDRLDEAFAQPFEKLREVGAALDKRKIVVLIDDLDRCTFNNVVGMLESINVITDVPGFIFVLALDYEVLIRAVEAHYPGLNGHEFIQKIIQVPFRIPSIAGEELAEINSLVPTLDEFTHLQGKVLDQLGALANTAFRGDPRALKRFINLFNLSLRIAELRDATIDHGLLATVLALQLRWPAAYEDLRDAVDKGDNEPLSGPRGDPEIAPVLTEQNPSLKDLEEALRLTSVVTDAPPNPAEQDEINVDPRSAGRAEVLGALYDLGFKAGRYSREYSHEDRPGIRVWMANLAARVETQDPQDDKGAWRLSKSFRFEDESRAAVQFLRDLAAGSPQGAALI